MSGICHVDLNLKRGIINQSVPAYIYVEAYYFSLYSTMLGVDFWQIKNKYGILEIIILSRTYRVTYKFVQNNRVSEHQLSLHLLCKTKEACIDYFIPLFPTSNFKLPINFFMSGTKCV